MFDHPIVARDLVKRVDEKWNTLIPLASSFRAAGVDVLKNVVQSGQRGEFDGQSGLAESSEE